MEIKKFIKRIARKIASEKINNQFSWNPPYNYVQNITVNNICDYLDLDKKDLNRWCIVGVYLGNEIPRILKNYPYVKIDAFECSKRYIAKLNSRFDNNHRVKIINKAVTSFNGDTKFYETNLNGNGSLLPLDELAKKSYGSKQKEEFTVKTTTLDTFYSDQKVDVLWIDVQGAEKSVLEGAKNTLKRVKAIFIEISILGGFYKNSVKMDSINQILKDYGFDLVLLGTDINLTGNALYIKTQDANLNTTYNR